VKKKVAILSSGSDSRKDRGYANSSLNLFFNLQKNDDCIVHFYKGDGKQDKKNNTYVVKNFGKQKWVHRKGNKIGDTFVYEYIIFALCFLFFSFFSRRKYDAIYTQEPRVAKTLYQLKFLLPGKPEICFGLGVKMTPEHYVNISDKVHVVNVEHYSAAITAYSDLNKFYLIPNPGSESKTYKEGLSKAELIRKFNIKTEKVVLSVGAINSSIKRMDYVVREASKLDSTWTLILLGSPKEKDIIEMGKELLGDRFVHLFVPPENVPEIFCVADVFVLASVIEGFGNVTIEAMQNGVPPVVHDRELNNWILRDDELLVDMLEENALYNFIISKEMSWFSCKGLDVKRVYGERYSWEALESKYLKLFNVTE
tara:strand:- start:3495 stop:4598 length:1104 start_codon:yes stop_codon:yes gene_type:complete